MRKLGPNKTKYKIPFDSNGNLTFQARGKPIGNYYFEDSIRVQDYDTARSETTGREYHLFDSEKLKLLQYGTCVKGEFKGIFTFKKQGSQFSISLVIDEKKEEELTEDNAVQPKRSRLEDI